MNTAAEREQPLVWLHALEEDVGALPRLVHESGGLPLAAWRVASARIRARGRGDATPTVLELTSAAMELAERVGWHEPTPTIEALTETCELGGLLVRH